ncbi:4-hydroxythreonine-4-phosphate dehydrogenase PdxA [Candidatus Pelagibacter bacterium]|jgi:4-hydroxy-L-threonine phosphate dehydrogenase PdxA|nr:4-hydroxythreonine-4-phosphate dehydrogenase PdxA [Candidatus Pelagibacter bacterium]MDC0447818.1 4-hydroxythreonine-4-phosphate dehydrogenase PdxA [Pelagibacteraceae bacterium]
MNRKIVLVGGDPNSINSEIIYKCWKKLPNKIKKRIILISNYKLLKDQFKKLNYNIKLSNEQNLFKLNKSNELKILNIKLDYKDPFKVPLKSAKPFVLKSLDLAHKLALNKQIAGIINCPINKNLLGNKKIGVTEYLANKCLVKKNSEVMIIRNKELMISPITTHLDIRSICNKINKKLIITKINVINSWFKKTFKRQPVIAVLGLNPHNAELRKNSEEKKIIIPAIKNLKKSGFKLDGPLSSDTIFINNYKNYDLIIGMYHDQILGPFKALYKFDAINLTLGLKYIRVSPDHGVAVDKIKKKTSSAVSLIKCFDYIDKFSI